MIPIILRVEMLGRMIAMHELKQAKIGHINQQFGISTVMIFSQSLD